MMDGNFSRDILLKEGGGGNGHVIKIWSKYDRYMYSDYPADAGYQHVNP